MGIAEDIEEIEAGLAEAGVTVKTLCAVAEINQSTWTRWKAGSNAPNMVTWSRVATAAKALCGGRAASENSEDAAA